MSIACTPRAAAAAATSRYPSTFTTYDRNPPRFPCTPRLDEAHLASDLSAQVLCSRRAVRDRASCRLILHCPVPHPLLLPSAPASIHSVHSYEHCFQNLGWTLNVTCFSLGCKHMTPPPAHQCIITSSSPKCPTVSRVLFLFSRVACTLFIYSALLNNYCFMHACLWVRDCSRCGRVSRVN